MNPLVGTQQEPLWLSQLNPPQRQAVETLDGPVLMLAGAGTGKTRALTARLANLLYSGRAMPGQILAVTFTNKAAREMQERVSELIGQSTAGWWLGTFHSIAARILRRHAEAIGLNSRFTILDDDDQLRLLKQLMQAANIDHKAHAPRELLNTISAWKDRGLSPAKLKTQDGGDLAGGRLVALYTAYQQRMLALNACDFGDLLLHNLTLFENQQILSDWQRRFQYMMVDEYQDTNTAQYLWLRRLAAANRNICVVGDDDQSIYGWRGAEIGNILRFEQDFPGAKVIKLEQNYRSTGHILAAAGGIIAQNRGRLGKTLWTAAPDGDKVEVHGCWDAEAEARMVSDRIEQCLRAGRRGQDMAILVRAGSQTRQFEERFLKIGLPYRIVGGLRFYERAEIRDALAYLRLVVSPADDLAFERVVNVPSRKLGEAAIAQIQGHARANSLPLFAAALDLVAGTALKPAQRQALGQFLQLIGNARAVMDRDPPAVVAQGLLDDAGYIAMWQAAMAKKDPEAEGRLDNLKELASAIAEFETLPEFLEHISLVMDNAESGSQDQVQIMTLHAAKGLEFPVVFLPGWEEDLFPSKRAVDDKGISGLEEERRLAYVGLTRARETAIISHAGSRMTYGQFLNPIPSRFIGEMPAQNVANAHGNGPAAPQARARAFQDWNRLIPSAARRPPVIDAPPQPVTRPSSSGNTKFEEGDRVVHDALGSGTIVSIDRGALTIRFDGRGTRKVMADYVRHSSDA